MVITNKLKTNNLRTNFRGDHVHIVYITLHFDEAIIIFVFYIIYLLWDKSLRRYHTLQGDNSLKSVERFDHMMFVCRFQASR